MQRVLSFEQTPPLAVPLRFFLTAPAFAAAAALLLWWHGGSALVSRWSPLTLAFTHLLTLGFLGLCMIGSVLQIMPVVAGVEVPRPALVAKLVHALLSAGAAALAAGFLWMAPPLFQLALVLLTAAFGIFLGACWLGLKEVESENVTLGALRLALLALGVTVTLGLVLGSMFAGPFGAMLPLPLPRLTDLHAAWGLAGWVGLLVIAVAFQVVPMFQVTETYPRLLTRWLARAVFGVLLFLSLAAAFAPASYALPRIAAVLMAMLYLAFAGVTARLIRRRKRPKPEPATFFWYLSLLSVTLACVLFALGQLFPRIVQHAAYPLCLGVLVLIGFGWSVVNGMLYKIVPFLIWYHLQDKLFASGMKAPNVREVIAEDAARRQFICHLAALCLLLLAVVLPDQLARVASIVLLASSGWLWFNLLAAARVYRGFLAKAGVA